MGPTDSTVRSLCRKFIACFSLFSKPFGERIARMLIREPFFSQEPVYGFILIITDLGEPPVCVPFRE